jgi:hypothetical protein
MTRIAWIAALVIALSGCATVSPPEPGFSDDEWADIVRAQGDLAWESYGFPAALRPPDPPMELVSRADYSARYAACMNDEGFDNYLPDGSVAIEVDGDDVTIGGSTQTDGELIANYYCSMRVVLRPEESGLLNRAERDYWYDYYEQWLVPCLVQHDIALFETQSREEFHESLGWWNPYYAVRQKDQELVSTDESLRTDCPAVPPGVDDPGYYYGVFTTN